METDDNISSSSLLSAIIYIILGRWKLYLCISEAAALNYSSHWKIMDRDYIRFKNSIDLSLITGYILGFKLVISSLKTDTKN